MNNCPLCGAPKPNDDWDWRSGDLVLPISYEDAMSLYDLLRAVQYGTGSRSQAYAGLAARVAERLSLVIDQRERGG